MEGVKKYSLIFFSFALLFPSAVSLTHINTHHEQEACHNFTDAHFHKKTLDCKLCDLRTNQFLVFESINYQIYLPVTPTLKSTNFYQFLSDYQKLPFVSRGPPPLQLS